jgi:hypothetical protein
MLYQIEHGEQEPPLPLVQRKEMYIDAPLEP